VLEGIFRIELRLTVRVSTGGKDGAAKLRPPARRTAPTSNELGLWSLIDSICQSHLLQVPQTFSWSGFGQIAKSIERHGLSSGDITVETCTSHRLSMFHQTDSEKAVAFNPTSS
jgi:hypothetical protein